MRSCKSLVFISCLALATSAYGVGLSAKTNGLYVAVAGWRYSQTMVFVADDPIRHDDKLNWRPFSDNGVVELDHPEPAYGIKIKMLGPDGKEVAKTKLGKTFGSKWGELHGYKDALLGGRRLGGVMADSPYDGHSEFSGQLLPAPKDLFKMNKEGIYTMEIEMQMFRYTGTTNTTAWEQNLIRFSPIKMKVDNSP